MQHARFKPHAEERTCNPTPSRDLTLGVVQQKEPHKTINPKVSEVHQERQN
jgi:hypothetical protein